MKAVCKVLSFSLSSPTLFSLSCVPVCPPVPSFSIRLTDMLWKKLQEWGKNYYCPINILKDSRNATFSLYIVDKEQAHGSRLLYLPPSDTPCAAQWYLMGGSMALNGRIISTEWGGALHHNLWQLQTKMDVLVFVMGRNQSWTSFGIIAITDIIHVLPDAVMVCFSLKQASFPDQCGIWLNSDVAFGLILMWHLA